jgi:hypothetical protein
MSLISQAPKLLSSIVSNAPANSSIWSIFSSFLSSGKGVLGTAKNVLSTRWSTLDPNSEQGASLRLAKLGGGALFSVWAAANAMGSFEKSRAAYHNTGNADGSIVFSGLQSAGYLISSVMPALAIIAPGPIRTLMQNSPLIGVVPGLLALAGTHFQGICTCDATHPLARIAQAGQGNWLLAQNKKEDPIFHNRSTAMPWWYRNVRSLDEKVMHAIGFKDFKRPTYSFSAYDYVPRPKYNQNA